jgi:Thioesterase-like superfamily
LAFEDDIALRPAGDGVWEGEVRGGWWTPRGPLGGYVMALMLAGFERAVADAERRPRSCTMHFLRPPHEGPVTVRTTVERAGRTLTSVSGRLEQDGKLMGLALGAFSTPWEGPLLDDAPIPDVPPPEDRMETGRRSVPDQLPPPFVERMVFQHRFGPRLFSRAEHGEVGGWLGLREERPIDTATVAVLADAWARSRLRPRSISRSTSARRCRSPTGCCSAASATGWCGTASSRRTASCGRRTGRWSRSRASSGS